MLRTIPLKYVLPLLGLTVSAFIFNTSEFMPIGLLIDISQSFGMTEDQTGIMITIYAWMVALLSLPLMLVLYRVELRKLLLATLSVFALLPSTIPCWSLPVSWSPVPTPFSGPLQPPWRPA